MYMYILVMPHPLRNFLHEGITSILIKSNKTPPNASPATYEALKGYIIQNYVKENEMRNWLSNYPKEGHRTYKILKSNINLQPML
jgi:hypothetical protein